MNMNPFLAQYKSYSDYELFVILCTRDQYQPQAVEAAFHELSQRNLTPGQWEKMQSDWQASQEEFLKRESFLQKRAGAIGDRINPFTRTGAEKDIAMIILSASFIIVFSLIVGYGTLKDILLDFSFESGKVLQILPFLLVPPALYFLHRRDRLGWIILTAWAIHNCLIIFTMIPWLLREKEFYFLYQPADPGSILVGLAIFGSLLAALIRLPVLTALGITAKMKWITLILSFLLSAFVLQNLS